MSDRLRREALREFRANLNDVIRCLAIAPVQITSPDLADANTLSFETPGESVLLRAARPLALRVRLRARIGPDDEDTGRWQARIVAYQYALLDGAGRKYLAYHWHPEGSSHVVEPHLHLGPTAGVAVPELAAAHLPTGPVALAAVARLAIAAFGARPLRQDWIAVLQRAAQPPAG